MNNMRRSKRAASMYEVIAALVIFLIVAGASFMVYYKTTLATKYGSETPTCFLSSVMTDNIRFLGMQGVEWVCPIEGPVKITEKTLKKKTNIKIVPKATMDAYGGKDAYKAMTGEKLAKYNLNTILASQLKRCHVKTAYGDSKLFSEWWWFFGLEEDIDDFKSYAVELFGSFDLMPLEFRRPPVGCGVCAIVYLDDSALKILKKGTVITAKEGYGLNQYMKSHPYQLKAQNTYWHFMDFDSKYNFFDEAVKFEYTIQGIDDPLAVIFARVEIMKGYQALKWGGDALKWTGRAAYKFWDADTTFDLLKKTPDPEGQSMYRILPVSELKKDCDYIANSFDDSLFT